MASYGELRQDKENLPLCECGCGEPVSKRGNRFVHGHNRRGVKCSREHRQKISEANIGKLHHQWGKPLTENHKRKLAQALKGQRNSQWHKKRGKEHRRKLSQAAQNRSVEWRRKQSEAHKGKKLSEEHKRNIGAGNKGKKLSKETKRKISDSKRGSKHPQWQGGKSFEPYGPKFNRVLKLAIRQRDGFICQLCGALESGQAHAVHHIDYDKTNNEPKNLITLCQSNGCHSRTHHNRAFWTKVFGEYMTHKGAFSP